MSAHERPPSRGNASSLPAEKELHGKTKNGSDRYKDDVPALERLEERVSAAREQTESRGETFYPGPSRTHLAAFPPRERWDHWVELDSKAWPDRKEPQYLSLIHI